MVASFFDVRPGPVELSPMFGGPHLLALVLLGLLFTSLVLARGRLRQSPSDHPWVRGLSWFILIDQLFLFALYFLYDYQPFWERFPLHLCAGLSLFVPTMMILGRLEAVRFVALWAVGAGFISIVNMSLNHNPMASYVYVHYLWMHYYLFGLPIYLVVRGDIRIDYALLIRSTAGLVALSAAIFGLDWALGANYMYIGPGSTLEIPFLPRSWTVWPWCYPTFAAVCVGLFHGVYLLFRALSPSEPSAAG
ncbi:MAG: YwaF family protein [Myxococcota bacterium]